MDAATGGRRFRTGRALRFPYRTVMLVIAAVGCGVTVLACVVAVLAWRFPQLPRGEVDVIAKGSGETVVVEGGADQSGPPEETPPAGGPIIPAGNPPPGTGGVTERKPPASPALPVHVSLTDGEQAVILGGRASIAVSFTQIGEEEFPSLRVEGDGAPKTLALLGPGGRVEFTAAGRRYVASVLRKDLAAKRLDLQVDAQQ